MANSEHVTMVQRGAAAVTAWRQEHPRDTLDLSGADLRAINLAGACLDDADLRGADLSHADLRRATFIASDMRNIRLEQAALAGAQLYMANLSEWVAEADASGLYLEGSMLAGADLRGAGLIGANLTSAVLVGAELANACMYMTILCDLDLSEVRGLDSVQHEGPSYVSMDTLLRSRGRIPAAFLRGCGVPEQLISFLPSLTDAEHHYYTCFLSYADKDEDFTLQLYTGLRAANINCWRWKEDAKWGRDLTCQIDAAIRRYDKLVVILSDAALSSEPVVREIARAIQKEQRENKEVLFPIRIDDAVFAWNHGYAADVTRKYIGDFTEWQDREAYDKSLARLIRDLRRDPELV